MVSTWTVLITDLSASTELRARLGEDAFDGVRREHDSLTDDAVAAHGGTVVKHMGDGVMAVFASASDALASAGLVQQRFAERNQTADTPLELRAGVSIGDAVVEENDLHGLAVVEARRLCDAARSGEVLCSEKVRQTAGSRGGHRFGPVRALDLKGLPEPLSACRLVWGDEPGEEAEGPAFRVLGPLTVEVEGEAVRLGGPKEQAVLALLLAAEGGTVSVEALVDGLWGDNPPRTAVRTVHSYIARLRRTLETEDSAPVLITAGRSYTLRTGRDQVDASRFIDAADRASAQLEQGDAGAALISFDDALAEWRGQPYAGHEDLERCAVAARALEERRRVVVERRFEALLALGQSAELIAPIEAALAEDPLREPLWGQLMVALYRAGRQADALRAYQRARQVLVDELGIEPGTALRELEASILAQDDRLLDTREIADLPRAVLPAALDASGSALLGREPELARLRAAWDDATQGHGSYLSIVGSEGIGKTRLAAELAATAHEQDAVVLFARCDAEHRNARALFDQALRSAGSSLVAVQATARPGDALGSSIALHLGTWSEHAPVLLVLDDLDAAGGDVLEVVADLASAIPQTAALVVGLFRTEPGEEPPSQAGGQQIALGGLDRSAVAEICGLYGDTWSAADIDRIHSRTGGVPLTVHEDASLVAREAMANQVVEAADQARVAEYRLVSSQQSVADHVLGLHRLAEQRRLQLTTRTARPTAVICPFMGLRYFDTDDAAWFFGRERMVAETLARLATRSVIGVVGASGTGKSSLVRAGVIPALAAGVLPGSATWRIVVGTPSEPSDSELHRALADAAHPSDESRVVLVVDQLEELFTLESDPAARAAFADALETAVNHGAAFIAMIRADQMGGVAELPALARLLGGNDVLVGPIRERELRDAIIRPAELAGLTLEDGLVDEIVGDARGGTDVLPLVQTALLETWVHRSGATLTVDAYEATGGVRGAVARLAERTYATLDDDEKAATRRIFMRLADVSGEGPTDLRRRIPRRDLAALDDAPAWRAVEHLVQSRLLSMSEDTVEVSHEALLREWPRLRVWLEDDLAGRRIHHRLEEAARSWAADDRDASMLLRGGRLSATDEWALTHDDDLNDLEREFLDASREEAGRELAEALARAERESRSSRRLRRLLAGAALLLAVAVVAGSLAVTQRNRADRSADQAQAAGLTADANRLASQALVDPRIDRALLTAVAGVELDDTLDTRAGLLAAIQRAPFALGIARLDNEARPQTMTVSTDGRHLAVADNQGLVHVLSSATLDEIGTVGPTTSWIPAFVADGRMVVGIRERDEVSMVVVDPDDPTTILERYAAPPGSAPMMSATPDGTRLLTVTSTDSSATHLALWDSTDLSAPLASHDVAYRVVGAALAPDGRTAVLAGADQVVTIDAETGDEGRTFSGERMVALSPDGSIVATTPDRGAESLDRRFNGVTLYEIESGREQRSLEMSAAVTDIRFDAAGERLLVGTDAGTEVWSVDGSRLLVLEGQTTSTRGVAMSPDGVHAFSGSLDGTIIRWDSTAREAVVRRWDTAAYGPATDPGPDLELRAPDGDVYYVQADEIAVRDAETGAVDESRTITTGQRFGVSTLDWSPDGRVLAAGSGDGSVVFIDRVTGDVEGRWISEVFRSVISVDYSADGQTLAVGLYNDPLDGGDGGPDVFLIDATTFEPVDHIEVDGEGLSGISLVLDQPGTDRLLLVHCCDQDRDPGPDASTPSFLALYDRSDHRELWRAEGLTARSAAFSDDGRRIVVGADDGRVWIVDATSGATLAAPVAAHNGVVETVQFSPDGELVVSAGTDGFVRLWRSVDLRPAGAFGPGPGIGGSHARFVDDGEAVMMLDDDRVWIAPIGIDALRDHVCAVTGRDLTSDEWSLLLPGRPPRSMCR